MPFGWEGARIIARGSMTVSDFIFGGSKITADGDCSHEIKRRLLLLGEQQGPLRMALVFLEIWTLWSRQYDSSTTDMQDKDEPGKAVKH